MFAKLPIDVVVIVSEADRPTESETSESIFTQACAGPSQPHACRAT